MRTIVILFYILVIVFISTNQKRATLQRDNLNILTNLQESKTELEKSATDTLFFNKSLVQSYVVLPITENKKITR